jgi:nucleotide-binding universal stress UspA family protein
METTSGLKQMEGQLSMLADRVTMIKAKLEDLLFRAQRIANAQKNNMTHNDTMFGYDLQHFRRDIRTFGMEISALPSVLGAIERTATYDEKAAKFAQSVMRLASRAAQSLKALHDTACLAHQHIRNAEHKIEAWYIAQEIEEMAQKGQALPSSANKIVIATSTPPRGAGAPPAAGGPTTPPGG